MLTSHIKHSDQEFTTFIHQTVHLGADPEDVILSAFKVLDPEATGTIKKEL